MVFSVLESTIARELEKQYRSRNVSLDVDHFHQAENQNTTHSVSLESHSHESTNCMEKLRSCINMPENAPAKTSWKEVALGHCSAYRAEASSQGCVSNLGVWNC